MADRWQDILTSHKTCTTSYHGLRRASVLHLLLLVFVVLVVHSLGQLLEKESALEAHFHDCAIQTEFAQAGGIVGLFDFGQAALELNAFAIICLFDGWRQGRVLRCVGCCAVLASMYYLDLNVSGSYYLLLVA